MSLVNTNEPEFMEVFAPSEDMLLSPARTPAGRGSGIEATRPVWPSSFFTDAIDVASGIDTILLDTDDSEGRLEGRRGLVLRGILRSAGEDEISARSLLYASSMLSSASRKDKSSTGGERYFNGDSGGLNERGRKRGAGGKVGDVCTPRSTKTFGDCVEPADIFG